MSITAGKIAEVMFEKFMETYEHQMSMLPLVDFSEPSEKDMQNTGNIIWRPIQQSRPIIPGWDLTGNEQNIIEETYPAVLGTPNNDLVRQRADDMRDMRFWERAAEQSGRRQATELNKDIAQAIVTQGSLFYRSNVTSGFDFIAEGQALMNERQKVNNGRCFILNDRDSLLYAKDLASRETVKGRPESTWNTGQIGSNVAEFDVYVGSFLPNITGGADPAVTFTGNQSFKPEAGSVNATTNAVTNIDYREASFVVNNSALVSVGDKFTIQNSAVDVQSVGLADKTATGTAMTWTVIEIPDSTHIVCYPKPIAPDDATLTLLEKSYSNIDTQILNAATLTRLNIDASNKTNIFFDKSAIEVIGGTIPAQLFKQFDGMKVISDTMSNGLKVYMVFDGDMITMNFRYRIFTWYGITVADPANCGVAVSY